MNKKYAIIFLILGLLSFVMFILYSYTDIFVPSSTPTPIEPTVTDNPNGQKIIAYDYVKSMDMNQKTKVTFPIYDKMECDDSIGNEYIRVYKGYDGLSLYAKIISNSLSNNDLVDEELDNYKEIYPEDKYLIKKNDVKCNYNCQQYTIYEEESIYIDVFKIYIKTSDEDVAIITYQSEKKELSKNLINEIINEIKISNDATYKIGIIDGDKLKIKLKTGNKEVINLSLDANIYEEIEEEQSTSSNIYVKNKNDGSIVNLAIRSIISEQTINDEIDSYFNSSNPGSNRKEMTVSNKKIYAYDLEIITCYAYIIDDNYALLINPKTQTINLNDFLSDIS